MRTWTEEQDRALWLAYQTAPGIETRNALVERYLGLVHHVARRAHRRFAAHGDSLDEVVSAGVFGLMQAVQAFDPALGHQFSTFAVRRIHGAILDDLRSKDFAPRSVRATGRVVERARADLAAAGISRPSVQELATAAGLSAEELHRQRLAESQAQVVSLEEPAGGEGAPLSTTMAPVEVPTALDRLVSNEQLALIQSMMAELPARERTVLVLHYYENLSFRQIAALLYVHETRVSQLHASAKRRLHALLAPSID